MKTKNHQRKKTIILLTSIILVLLIILLIIIFIETNKTKVCFEKKCFYVEEAKTSAEQAEGLMFRQNLGNNQGMLFIFETENTYSFWMKNTLIPLDIIWVNKNNEVVFIYKNALPCKEINCPVITPTTASKYVLEINAGLAEKYDISAGDKVEIKYIK